MTKLLKVAGVTAAAVAIGGFAMASVERGGDALSVPREQTSVVLAVTPPEHGPRAPAIDRAPAPPTIPPLPNRAPRLPTLDLANDASGASALDRLRDKATRALTTRPAPVRAAPSDEAPMLYGFPAKREIRVIGKDGAYVHIVDIESGAEGWMQTAALTSDMMTASVEPESTSKSQSKRAKHSQHAVADIKSPQPVKPIRQERKRTPFDSAADDGGGTNFASFVRNGLGGAL